MALWYPYVQCMYETSTKGKGAKGRKGREEQSTLHHVRLGPSTTSNLQSTPSAIITVGLFCRTSPRPLVCVPRIKRNVTWRADVSLEGKGEVLYFRTYCCMISLASPRCAVAAVGDTGEREEYTDFRKHHAANMRSYYQYEACGCQKTRGSTKINGQLYLCCCRGLTIQGC